MIIEFEAYKQIGAIMTPEQWFEYVNILLKHKPQNFVIKT